MSELNCSCSPSDTDLDIKYLKGIVPMISIRCNKCQTIYNAVGVK